MGLGAKQIALSSVEIKTDDTFVYHYDAGAFMRHILTNEPLWARYEGSVNDVPPGIVPIPFLGMILPIIWFYDCVLDVDVMDETYACSMDAVKAAYQALYPKIRLAGRVNIGTRVATASRNHSLRAALFTGGIDSMATVLQHRQENPLLISIRGSEARVHQEKAWQQVDSAQSAAAAEMGLRRAVISSNYLEVLQQRELDIHFPGRLQRSWYTEVAYGPIFLGLSAPLTWREGVGTLYIASSLTAVSGPDGSCPALVENTAWAGTRIVYDGGDRTRQAKLERIVTEIQDSFPKLRLNVCALGKDEGNCCLCEKCSRTMAGLALAGVDPARHGFVVMPPDTPGRIRRALINNEWQQAPAWQVSTTMFWREIQEQVPQHQDTALPQWREFFDWLAGTDVSGFFRRPPRPRHQEMKRLLKRSLPFSLFVTLRRWKRRLMGQLV